jgi:hypothetical protein
VELDHDASFLAMLPVASPPLCAAVKRPIAGLQGIDDYGRPENAAMFSNASAHGFFGRRVSFSSVLIGIAPATSSPPPGARAECRVSGEFVACRGPL